jgi:hypothetical protein
VSTGRSALPRPSPSRSYPPARWSPMWNRSESRRRALRCRSGRTSEEVARRLAQTRRPHGLSISASATWMPK